MTGPQLGTRVVGVGTGAFAEYMVLQAAAAMPVPSGWTEQEALGLVVNWPTALAALKSLGRVAAGEIVLVHAAAGATGQAAVTMAKHYGATVIAAASRGKHETVVALGADHVLDPRDADIAAEVMRLTGSAGADVVLESAGGATFDASPAATKRVTGRAPQSAAARRKNGGCRLTRRSATMVAMSDEAAHDQQRHRPSGVPPLVGEDHTCGACGVSCPTLTVEAARAIIGSVPRTVQPLLEHTSPQDLLYRSRPERWSAKEYVFHIRDVCVVYTIRLHRARTEDLPVLEPMLNDLRARRFHYNDRTLDGVFDELAACVAGLCEEIERCTRPGWERTVTRLAGEHRTARWLVRQAAHEAMHHLEDIRACLAEAGGSKLGIRDAAISP
ncbi:zinc-binding dehydrogenase [Amycolatopsis sp. NPDC004378]